MVDHRSSRYGPSRPWGPGCDCWQAGCESESCCRTGRRHDGRLHDEGRWVYTTIHRRHRTGVWIQSVLIFERAALNPTASCNSVHVGACVQGTGEARQRARVIINAVGSSERACKCMSKRREITAPVPLGIPALQHVHAWPTATAAMARAE